MVSNIGTGILSPVSTNPPPPTPPPWLIRAAALASCLVVSKLALVALRVADGAADGLLASAWAAPALLFEDALLVALLAVVDVGALSRLPWPRLAWAPSVAASVWAAINVPIARVFSTPLTDAMLGAVGGAISDSIFQRATPANLLAGAAVLATAWLSARLARRVGTHKLAWAVGAPVAVGLLLGPIGLDRATTLGVHRNAVVTLARTTWRAHRPPPAPAPDWSDASLPAEGEAADLTHLAGAARGKHVIMVVLESTGARHLEPWGGARDAMPRLSQLLSSRSVLFDRAYAAYPESIKGFYSYLCGVYPAAHTKAESYTPEDQPTRCAGDLFSAAGYHTGLFHSGRFIYLGMRHIVRDRGFDALEDAGTIGGEHASSFGTDDASTARRVLSFIDEAKARDPHRPVFAMYMPIAGHHPYRSPGTGPRPFPQETEYDAYLNDLHAGDAALGLLMDGVRERGMEDDTVWVVFGDHGEAFHEHEGNFAHSLFVYEENLHVPLAFVLPGAVAGVARAPQIVSLVDVLPTLLAVVGQPAEAGHQGRSVLTASPGVAPFYTDHGVWQMGLRQGPWKVIIEVEAERARLFDLRTDPGEVTDVSAQHPERVERYRAYLREWHRHQHQRITKRP